MGTKVSREELLDALRAFAAELGETPTRTQMNDDGPYSSTPFENEFSGWAAALRAAGLTPNHENDIDDERLIAELQRLDEDLDRVPRFEDMAEQGAFSPHTYVRRWGSWPEAMAAADVVAETRTSRRIPKAELEAAMRAVAADLGKTPTQEEMRDHGPYSQRPYYRAWDSWNGAVRAAGLDPNDINGIEESVLLDELRALADDLGHAPTMDQMRTQGEFSPRPYLDTFGSWTNAWDAAGLEARRGGQVERPRMSYSNRFGRWPTN